MIKGMELTGEILIWVATGAGIISKIIGETKKDKVY